LIQWGNHSKNSTCAIRGHGNAPITVIPALCRNPKEGTWIPGQACNDEERIYPIAQIEKIRIKKMMGEMD
jgi:hypothetical protein